MRGHDPGNFLAPPALMGNNRAMTNRIALILGLIIAALIAFDVVLHDGRTMIFLSKKLIELLEWIAFWR